MTTVKKTQKSIKEASEKAAPAKKSAPAKKAAPVKKTVVETKKPAVAKKAAAEKKVVKKVEKKVEKRVEKRVEKKPESTLGRIKIKPSSVDVQKSAPVTITNERPKNVGIDPSGKRRLVVSYSNMKEDVAAAFKEKYPKGYADYMGDLFKVDKPDGSSFYAITLETDDAIYLIKMVVTIDRVEDAQKTLFPDSDGSDDIPTEGETFPDDNTENMSDSDDDIE